MPAARVQASSIIRCRLRLASKREAPLAKLVGEEDREGGREGVGMEF